MRFATFMIAHSMSVERAICHCCADCVGDAQHGPKYVELCMYEIMLVRGAGATWQHSAQLQGPTPGKLDCLFIRFSI